MYKRIRFRGERVAVAFTIVPSGSIGRSIEFDVWVGSRYRYLSIGKRYSGRFWIRTGGH
jgi:hypothetical protein